MAQPQWITDTNIGTYPANIATNITLVALPVTPATTVTYKVISGALPPGLTLSNTGKITGTPLPPQYDVDYRFVIRATDNLNSVSDKSFTITISFIIEPRLTVLSGTTIINTVDSKWINYAIPYSNTKPSNIVKMKLVGGKLPPGLELVDNTIRGYAAAPKTTQSSPALTVQVYSSDTTTGILKCNSTSGFLENSPIFFDTGIFGNIVQGTFYFIDSVIDDTNFTIRDSINGPKKQLATASGIMQGFLPAIPEEYPIAQYYNISIQLESNDGFDFANYYIYIANQEAIPQFGGSGGLPYNRPPAILNKKPRTVYITDDDIYSGYYRNNNLIGTFEHDNYAAFKIIGHDWDGSVLEYVLTSSTLPTGMTFDSATGWLYGTPLITTPAAPAPAIYEYSITVTTRKLERPWRVSDPETFTFYVARNTTSNVTWTSNSNLGTLYNGQLSELSVRATASTDINLVYTLVSGNLPPNLVLHPSGEIQGKVAQQPNQTYTTKNTTTTYTFTVSASNPGYTAISSTKQYSITVIQLFEEPYETVYMRAGTSIADRYILRSLLTDSTIIPPSDIYRPSDEYFGIAKTVIYEHAYGVRSSTAEEYSKILEKNYYNRKLVLGELKTAIARDNNGNILYEVVYSKIIDDLLNTKNVSIPLEITWPRNIVVNSTTTVNKLYPASIPNMRVRLNNSNEEVNPLLLPKWMTSQQLDGSIPGFIAAWVLCYTKPGKATSIMNNIKTKWNNKLNNIEFEIDRIIIDKSNTYNYDKSLLVPAWSTLPSAPATLLSQVGTISTSNSNNIVTGISTKFITQARVGQAITTSTGQYVGIIKTIISDYTLYLTLPSPIVITNAIWNTIESKNSNDIPVIFPYKTILPRAST